jgi:hypothetical protein
MNCTQFGDWKYYAALSAWLLLEFWLGKTQKTRAASTIELIGIVVISAILWVYWALKTKGNQDGK